MTFLTRHFLLFLPLSIAIAACSAPPDDPSETSGEALTNPLGAELAIDAARLASSLHVVTNATVTPAEVARGCAHGLTGRTLVRFDVKTPNRGPGALGFGTVKCTSTVSSPACQSADCSTKPECCANGTSVCQGTADGRARSSLKFSPDTHRLELDGFVRVRLLKGTQEVAGTNHTESACVADAEDVTPGSCKPPHRFACGEAGLHVGCAAVIPATAACAYVDVTGLADGDYTLEARVDPQDVVDESNETNNTATAPVHLGPPPPPPPPPPTQPVFLVRKGLGSLTDAKTYQTTIAAPATLAAWKTQFLGAVPVATGFYRNKNELGFWREMTCAKAITRGQGGCMVTNWHDPGDKAAGRPNLATVAMNVSEQGFTRFYVFGPDGSLSPSALLDTEGPKFVPQLCTTCHGGTWQGPAGPADLGSVFREFEPSLLQLRPGATQAQSEQEWFDLNQAIKGANAAINTEAQGAPAGTDHAKASVLAYIAEMYPTNAPPARAVSDAAHVPSSWKTGSAVSSAAKSTLFTKVVNPYCMSCHRVNSVDFTDYARFQFLGVASPGQLSMLKRYTTVNAADPNRLSLAFMPQAKLEWENLAADTGARAAIDAWLVVAQQP